jgi:Zn-finger nucleic acid-binding protein
MRNLNCPRCELPMTSANVRTASGLVLIDLCSTSCGGIWLDDTDMSSGLDVTDDLQTMVVHPIYTPDTSQRVSCPVCQETMERYRWNYTSPVSLDQCPTGHGTWVDHGEVQAMEEFEEREVLSPQKKVQLQARMGMERLQMEAEHRREVVRAPHPALSALQMIWERFL